MNAGTPSLHPARVERVGIVHQPEDPELRRHRERVLEAMPWLRAVGILATVVTAVVVLVDLCLQLFG